ncbi:MAG: porin, partial [Rhodoferax sp.]|nr:porin [Rhodoferax sp.]
MTHKSYVLLLSLLAAFGSTTALAQKAGSGSDQIATFASPIESFPTEGELFGLPVNIHGQTTYINQRYKNFNSSYSGQNSLNAQNSMSYSWSGTLFMGARIAPDTDIYFNPEVVSGVPFSGLVGLGGFPNGEGNKASGTQAKFYSARAFARHTINQEGDKLVLEDQANQITQTISSNRVVLTGGQFSTLDIFDDSRYAK